MPRPLLAMALAVACVSPAWATPPKVVTDIAAVHSLVSRVMDGAGEPDLLIPPGASPHFHALKPSDAKTLREAGIIIKIGPQLSPWMDRPLTSLAGSAQRLRLLEQPGTITLPARTGATFEPHDHAETGHDGHETEAHGAPAHGPDEHAHGHDAHASGDDAHAHGSEDHAHDHGPIDAHAWLDPENGKLWLSVIADALSELDPGNAALYGANAAAGADEIDAAIRDTRAILAPMQDLRFIVFHDAYQYFERRFGLTAVGAIALSDASPPGPARIAELRERVAAMGVSCALTEPQFDLDLVMTVFGDRDIKTAVVDPAGSSIPLGPGMYPDLIRSIGTALAACD